MQFSEAESPQLMATNKQNPFIYKVVRNGLLKMSESQTKAGNQRKFENLKKIENFKKFENLKKMDNLRKLENLKFKIAQVDPRDMLNNFCFHV